MSVAPDPADPVAVARRHLELRTAVVVTRLLAVLDEAYGRGLFDRDDVERRFPFLAGAADDLSERVGGGRAEHPEGFRRRADRLADEADGPPPLARLAATERFAGSGPPATVDGELAADVLAAAALVERDVRFGAVFAELQGPGAVRRPCIGLLAVLFERDADEVARLVAALAGAGFVAVDNPDDPRAERTVRLPGGVLAVVEGWTPDGVDLRPASAAPRIDELVLPEPVRQRVERAATLLERGELDAVVLRGGSGTGRRTALAALARRLDRSLLVADPARPGPWGAMALLAGAVLAWRVDPGPGELATVARPPGVGPLGVVCGRRGAVRVDGADRVVALDLPVPDPGSRRRFWSGGGLEGNDEVLDTVSTRYVLSGGTIVAVAAQARAIARLDGRPTVGIDDVRQAAQEQGRQRLESLARLLAPVPDGFAPVLSGAAAEAYEALVLRSRHREHLAGAVGGAAGEQVNRGVRALLTGPSGTGKTLAARALGTRLHLDVYRADLAALVDKYIGETERRLEELFTAAEELDAVLLIDEGDALMTRRTDVRSSNDRYANLETDYLLQRLETFEGIVVVTTNSPGLVDKAFQRRLDVTVAFSLPGGADRLEIWRRHLPRRHAVRPATVEDLAVRCRLTGGQIRNATVHAALLALDADRLVDDRLLLAAVEREYTVAGRSSPLAAGPSPPSPFEQAMARP